MSKTVISVNNLSKRYRLGLREKQAETLVGQVGNLIKSPWQNLKRLQALNKFGKEDDSVFWALKDINFEVKEGEVLGIIGKNGAGKSTLLKILSQITQPTSGKIEIHGRVASLLEVGTGFHGELSGRENIYMNGTILGMTRREIDSKLEEIIDFSGIEIFIDTPVKFYSSGMNVRLGFAVAAHLEPEILIIDEVLAVGDFEFQAKCLGKMDDISKNNGKTILFVSHNLSAINDLCSSCLYLESGKLKSISNTETAIKRYLNLTIGKSYSKDINHQNSDIFLTKAVASYDDDVFRRKVLLELEIFSKIESKIAIDLRLKTSNFLTPIAYGSLGGFSQKDLQSIVPGKNVYTISFDLDFLASGDYLVSIDLTEPFVRYFDKNEDILSFEKIDVIDSQKKFQLGWNLGAVRLDLRNE